jgi:protein-disulfide isomerase
VTPQLVRDYVAAGKVRFEFRDYAFLGKDSTRAAEAAACALDQGKFWEYHETIFANHQGENVGAYSSGRLKEMAGFAGLDEAQFASCLDERAHEGEIAGMVEEARGLGISGTPSFVIDGELVGWRGYEDLRARIDAALQG